ncbi:hypothetical protein E0L93_14385 [Rubrobacter taiwanensis]|uniref:Uncharacterized protein n=2 Tax=Rubrobacter taiwanensis TaxID=185139 RepID=A0A4R1BAB1_9ACTN|nr:hypothetical protein E0L93_14385 [Rubrobacter taiwanensis]
MKKMRGMLGRGKVTVLAVVVALVLVSAPAVFAHGGYRGLFHLGHNNYSKTVSTLIKQGPGPALRLLVGPGQPPMMLNSSARVANLNADKLDGLDSGAFGMKLIKSGMQFTDECSAVNAWNECVRVQVTVPAGKTYEALITAEATFYEYASGENRVLFCPSARKTTDTGANCTGEERGLLLKNDEMESVSDTTVRTLTEGTWIISSAVKPSDPLDPRSGFHQGKAQTVVLIRDASTPLP